MDIYRTILMERMPGVGTEGKILFLRFLLENEERGLTVTVRKLGVAYGVPLKVIAQAAGELERAGYWTRVPVPGERGRPSFAYQVVPTVWERLESDVGTQRLAARLRPYIERLNQNYPGAGAVEEDADEGEGDRPSKPPSRKGEGNRLSNPNRLLLMVLLALADDMGVVRGSGIADLAALTGLTKGRVQSQVEKLLRLQFLRTVIPGISGSRLFGKVPGVYFLNLHRSWYGMRDQLCGAIILLEAVTPCMREGPALINAARDGVPLRVRRCPRINLPADTLTGSEGEIQALAGILGAPHSGGLPDYLQHTIETYASMLLSQRWVQLGAGQEYTSPTVYGDHHLVEEIARCLMPRRTKKKGGRPVEVPAEYWRLGSLILVISARLAEMIKHTLVRTRLPSVFGRLSATYSEMKFLLMPAVEAEGGRYFSVIVMPKWQEVMIGRTYVARVEYGLRWNQVWGGDDALMEAQTESELLQWGLVKLSRWPATS